MLLHGSSAARDGDAVLLLGPPGAGKSDLVLRLLGRGWRLVADDQVELARDGEALAVASPASLAGLLEVRGLGIFAGLAVAERPRLRCAIDLIPRAAVPRLPSRAEFAALGVTLPRLALHAFDASAPDKVEWALAAATARAAQRAGAFAA
jgi:serine kinase of HPr protein (carbohydrate metabolism regulator)